MNEPDEDWYSDLVMELEAGRLTPFLGAGVNTVGVDRSQPFKPGNRLPDAAELAHYLVEKRDYGLRDGDKQELLKVAQAWFSRLGTTALYAELHQLFNHDFPPTPVHQVLAAMPEYVRTNADPQLLEYPLFVTTNYDDALERALTEHGEQFDVLTYIATGKRVGKFQHTDPSGKATLVKLGSRYQGVDLRERSVVLKLHAAVWRGAVTASVSQDSYVITEDDYIESMAADVMANLPVAVSTRMQACHYLFLGYSLRDWNLRAMLHRIWKEHIRENTSWAIERQPDKNETSAWKARDVEIFELDLEEFAAALDQQLAQSPSRGRVL
jgi:SIR2-like domain